MRIQERPETPRINIKLTTDSEHWTYGQDTGERKPKTGPKPQAIQPSQSSGFMKAVQVLLPIILLVIALGIKLFGSPKET